jgi:hypothetical protein
MNIQPGMMNAEGKVKTKKLKVSVKVNIFADTFGYLGNFFV